MADDIVTTNAKQLGQTSQWGKTPRQVATDFNPDKVGVWGGSAIHAAAVELRQKLPSRSRYRSSDAPIDTLAGFAVNTDAATHVLLVESGARVGDTDSLAILRARADAGDARAKLVLQSLTTARTTTHSDVVSPAAARAAAGLTDALPTSVADFFTPARRGLVHWVVTTVLAALAVTVTAVNPDSWATWTPLIVGVVLAVFDLGVSITHSKSGLRTAVYGLILAVQPVAVILHVVTDAQWTAVAPLLAAVLSGALAAAKTPKW